MEKKIININIDEIKPLDVPLRTLRRKSLNFSLNKIYKERVE